MLKETKGDNDELIEGLEMHVDLIEIIWHKFLAFEIKFEEKNSGNV